MGSKAVHLLPLVAMLLPLVAMLLPLVAMLLPLVAMLLPLQLQLQCCCPLQLNLQLRRSTGAGGTPHADGMISTLATEERAPLPLMLTGC